MVMVVALSRPDRSPSAAAPRLSATGSSCRPTTPWHDVTSVVPRAAATARVIAEKRRGTGDILVFGSRTMWNGPLLQGLADEIHLMVRPRALAGGTPTVDRPTDLHLLDVRRPEGSDNVLLRYAVRR
ncbi:hypothetical protein [Geodermatophilus sabuli]|uniref:hypothetical protein n=1 Tax=Geodermatophilus sabuli TaxID=1564158 RepID=UPI000BE23602|nr:hypothetical protein [Geodermatophilus sabuli]MBB3084645.1 dihydrofolate reductase [Geodermatophilus sabuli]